MGNEKADELAKRGSDNTEDQSVNLSVPMQDSLEERPQAEGSNWLMRARLKDMSPQYFRTVWRDSYAVYPKSLSNQGINKLRATTQYLTGHHQLNYHLNKHEPQSISKMSSLLHGG